MSETATLKIWRGEDKAKGRWETHAVPFEHGQSVLDAACNKSLEGIISKRANAAYRSGRTGSWTKSKCRLGHEVVIGG